MSDAAKFLDDINSARIQRVRELSEVKRTFFAVSETDPLAIASKSAVVLTYANWEGFYNDCVRIYLEFLGQAGAKVADASWLMLVGALSAEFKSLHDRKHSSEGRLQFIRNLKLKLSCGFDDFDRTVVMSRSNLDFSRLRENLSILDFQHSVFEVSRIRIDKELVGWRHGVAHGDPPNLSTANISDHIDFAAKLMLQLSDLFQAAILTRV